MGRDRSEVLGILLVLFLVPSSFALEYDFVLNETAQSYRSSFTNPTEKAYMDPLYEPICTKHQDPV